MTVITVLVFIAIFGLIVFVHELGHFLVAKWTGVYVEEFAFGFPPRLIGRKRGETLYAINAIPLGGYVKMRGEDGESEDPRAFSHKPPHVQMAIAVAGVAMNVILAWVLLTTLLVLPPSLKGTGAIFVASVQSGSAAASVGLRVGDIVVKGNDVVLHSPTDLHQFTHDHQGETVSIVVQRSGKEFVKQPTLGSGEAPLGVSAQHFSVADLHVAHWWQAPQVALEQIWTVIKINAQFFVSLLSGLVGFGPPPATDQVSGPVGIYGVVAQFVALGWVYVLLIMAQLSLAVAIFNILPIPALDGGRILFIGLNRLFRRNLVPHRIETLVHTIGFGMLILLFVFVTYRDIVKLLR